MINSDNSDKLFQLETTTSVFLVSCPCTTPYTVGKQRPSKDQVYDDLKGYFRWGSATDDRFGRHCIN